MGYRVLNLMAIIPTYNITVNNYIILYIIIYKFYRLIFLIKDISDI